MDILGRLVEIRKKKKISQVRMAKKLGFKNPSSVSALELGRADIQLRHLQAYARECGCKIILLEEEFIENLLI